MARRCPPKAAARAAGLGYDAERLRRNEGVDSESFRLSLPLTPAWRANADPRRPGMAHFDWRCSPFVSDVSKSSSVRLERWPRRTPAKRVYAPKIPDS